MTPSRPTRARTVVSAARIRVFEKLPFLSAVLYSLRLVEREGLGTFAVDPHMRMYYDPQSAEDWGTEGVSAVLLHETGHVARDHFSRGDAIRAALGARLSKLNIDIPFFLNVVGDMEINDDVQRAGFRWPKGLTPVAPQTYGLPEGKTMEWYAERLVEKAESGEVKIEPGPSSVPGCGGKCGGCAQNPNDFEDGPDEKAEQSGEGKPISAAKPSDQKVARVAVAKAVQASAPGTTAGSWKVWASKHLEPPKVDWRKRLQSAIRSGYATQAGAHDYVMSRPSRRSQAVSSQFGNDVAMPGMRSPKVDLVIAIDTSGSMGGARLKRAAAELVGIVKATGFPALAFSVDAAIQNERMVNGAADLEVLLKGGGGTDMRLAYAHAEKTKKRLMVLLTDGETAWPERHEIPKGLSTIVCIVGSSMKVPSWCGTEVRVDS